MYLPSDQGAKRKTGGDQSSDGVMSTVSSHTYEFCAEYDDETMEQSPSDTKGLENFFRSDGGHRRFEY